MTWLYNSSKSFSSKYNSKHLVKLVEEYKLEYIIESSNFKLISIYGQN